MWQLETKAKSHSQKVLHRVIIYLVRNSSGKSAADVKKTNQNNTINSLITLFSSSLLVTMPIVTLNTRYKN